MFRAVFRQEVLRAGRRHHAYFLRWLYAAILLAQLLPALSADADRARHGAVHADFFAGFLTQHLAFLFLITPALAAGAITDEKTRGTLAVLLTAHLRPLEIILGKLFSCVSQVLVLALVGLPLLAFFGTLSDLDLGFAPALVAVSLVLVLALAALGLLASVWCQRTRDAMLGSYLVLLAGAILAYYGIGTRWAWLVQDLDPWYAVALDDPDRHWVRLGRFALAWLMPAAGCIGLAAWRLRPAYLRQLRATTCRATTGIRPRSWHAAHPRVRGNPVAWREQFVRGVAPLAWMRAAPRWLGLGMVAIASTAGMLWLTRGILVGVEAQAAFEERGLAGVAGVLQGIPANIGIDIVATHGSVAILLLALFVAIRASGSISEERERNTWESLLLTPMPTDRIVHGKFFGLLRATVSLLTAYAMSAVPLAYLLGWKSGIFSLFLTLGMLIVTIWIAAVGLCCSAYCRSSWRSLLVTLVGSILGLQLVVVPISMAIGTALGMSLACLTYLDGAQGMTHVELFWEVEVPGICLVVALVVTWLCGQTLLSWAEQRINKLERTKVRAFSDAAIRRWAERREEELRAKIARETLAPIPLVDDDP